MDTSGIFDATLSKLEKNLDVRTRKHNLIVSNVANMDTPNYRPFDFIVEEAMGRILANKDGMAMTKTNSGHLASSGEQPGSQVNDRQLHITRKESEVDIDKTMSDLSQNSILYNASAQILSKKYSLLKEAIRGGSN
jgi:flagellar basal-body rod protein FlgB